jgi:hypothetical protein
MLVSFAGLGNLDIADPNSSKRATHNPLFRMSVFSLSKGRALPLCTGSGARTTPVRELR